jgi:excisionase family DNA binding protein
MNVDFITPKEASKLGKVSTATIYNWCSKYGIGFKVGGRWKIKKTELLNMQEGIIPL